MAEELALHIEYENQLLAVTNFALLLALSGLAFAALMDPYMTKRQKWLLLIADMLAGILVIQGQMDNFFSLYKVSRMGVTIIAMLGYQIRPMILAVFILLTDSGKRHWDVWSLLTLNTLVYAAAPFSDMCFMFTEEFVFVRGPMGYTCHMVSVLLLIYLLAESIGKYGKVKRQDAVIPVWITVVIIGAVLADFVYGRNQWISYLTVAIVAGCLCYYAWLHLQFAMEHENSLLAEQRIQIMISQIQPHFLYNTLSTIQALCKIDPEKAFEVTEQFGTYLRQNIDSLENAQMIPFEKELEHTMVYAGIEMVRFPNIHMEYDISEKEFYVPALTLQPIVENSVRHGVRIREEGIIRVKTAKVTDSETQEEFIELVVSDNGVGFEVNGEPEGQGTHIGMKNVRERIEKMCGGSLIIKSAKGEGTTIIMRFPVKRCKGFENRTADGQK